MLADVDGSVVTIVYDHGNRPATLYTTAERFARQSASTDAQPDRRGDFDRKSPLLDHGAD